MQHEHERVGMQFRRFIGFILVIFCVGELVTMYLTEKRMDTGSWLTIGLCIPTLVVAIFLATTSDLRFDRFMGRSDDTLNPEQDGSAALLVIHFNKEIEGQVAEAEWERCSGLPDQYYAIREECGCRRVSINAWPMMPATLFHIRCELHKRRPCQHGCGEELAAGTQELHDLHCSVLHPNLSV